MTETTAQPSLEPRHKRKEQAYITLENNSGKKKKTATTTKKQSLGEAGSKWQKEPHELKKNQHQGLNVPVNHMIDVVSY